MPEKYPACFFKEKDGYSVVFPDLNWLSTCGDTLAQALSAAENCLAGYLYLAREDGSEVPPASDPGQIDLKAVGRALDNSRPEGFVSLVTVDVGEFAKKALAGLEPRIN